MLAGRKHALYVVRMGDGGYGEGTRDTKCPWAGAVSGRSCMIAAQDPRSRRTR